MTDNWYKKANDEESFADNIKSRSKEIMDDDPKELPEGFEVNKDSLTDFFNHQKLPRMLTDSPMCTYHALFAANLLQGKVYGFKFNGGIISNKVGGHDFALIDNRYIVDSWLTGAEWIHEIKINQFVFDLEDPHDQEMVAELYGDPKTWKLMYDFSGSKEAGSNVMSKTAMEFKMIGEDEFDRDEEDNEELDYRYSEEA
jgi:hypothetical protein